MAGIRIRSDFFIPEAIYQAIPAGKKLVFRDMMRELKSLAIDLPDEDTTRAVWHKCFHDEKKNQPCDPEQEI